MLKLNQKVKLIIFKKPILNKDKYKIINRIKQLIIQGFLQLP